MESFKIIAIQREPKPLYPAGIKYIAYQSEGDGVLLPLCIAAETLKALKARVLQLGPVSTWIHACDDSNSIRTCRR